MTRFVFDGSFEGLLTAFYEFYDRKPQDAILVSERDYMPSLLDEVCIVTTDAAKASRVWKGLRSKMGKEGQLRFYTAFLSEQAEAFEALFRMGRYVFDHPKGAVFNFGHADVLAVARIAKSVNRERHRMKAFVRFQELSDGMFYARVAPDFNVLPLISEFFKNRYASQRWLIYDTRRHYGIYYDLKNVAHVTLEPEAEQPVSQNLMHEREPLYAVLWADYFKSTNIPARKNTKLHLRHVPKRYWKYLTEKNPDTEE